MRISDWSSDVCSSDLTVEACVTPSMTHRFVLFTATTWCVTAMPNFSIWPNKTDMHRCPTFAETQLCTRRSLIYELPGIHRIDNGHISANALKVSETHARGTTDRSRTRAKHLRALYAHPFLIHNWRGNDDEAPANHWLWLDPAWRKPQPAPEIGSRMQFER